MAVIVRPAATGAERDACYLVRMAVFVDEQKVPPWEELDHLDEEALHFLAELAEEEGKIVGAARLVDKGDGIGKIGRVAVLKEHRERGIGRTLMSHVMEAAFQRFHTLILDAQVQVIPFYEKFGFAAEGDVFLDAGIEHRAMSLKRYDAARPRATIHPF